MTREVKEIRKKSIDFELEKLNKKIADIDLERINGQQLKWILNKLVYANEKIDSFLKEY